MEQRAEPASIAVGAGPLTLETLDACLARPLRLDIPASAWDRARRGRGWVDELLRGDEAIYGINTGFGFLKNTRIPDDQLDRLQENLLLSHAVGVGPSTPPSVVRWMLLFKVHMLLQGHSGVRVELIERLAAWLNADVMPVVPTRGSLGASGDLAPLAHLVLPLIGRGEMWRGAAPTHGHHHAIVPMTGAECDLSDREWVPVALNERNAKHGWTPLRLAAKEGLALINGTQFMAAYGAHITVRARRLVDLADLILCMSLEALRGSIRPMDPRLHALRPHPGAKTVAARIRAHLRDSEILESHANCDKVQDPYSLRCAPQVHGAVRDVLDHVCGVVEREINSVTDNPILFGGDANTSAEAISGGAFHGEPLALSYDYLSMALTEIASISERRVYLLLGGEDGLPKLLIRDSGVNSGFMLPQYTAAALLNECKVLSAPACVDSIPTSLGQEDHVSMGATAALKLYEILDRVETALAIEMLTAAQALDFRLPLRAGVGPRSAHALIRRNVPHADRDREFGRDIRSALRLLRRDEELRRIARSA